MGSTQTGGNPQLLSELLWHGDLPYFQMIRQWPNHTIVHASLISCHQDSASDRTNSPDTSTPRLRSRPTLPQYLPRPLTCRIDIRLVSRLIVSATVMMAKNAGFDVMIDDSFKYHHADGEERCTGLFFEDRWRRAIKVVRRQLVCGTWHKVLRDVWVVAINVLGVCAGGKMVLGPPAGVPRRFVDL